MKAAWLATATLGASLLLAACGGGSDGGGQSSNQTQADNSSGGATNTSAAGGGSGTSGTMGSGAANCQAPSGLASSDTAVITSYDAPMVFLAQPGPITATLLQTPTPDPSTGSFATAYRSSGAIGHDLGITSGDVVGKTVTTISFPAQPAGVPIIFQTHATTSVTLGTIITTGWIGANDYSCCEGFPKVRAEVTFGPNSTAIVSFGSPSPYLPSSWATKPLKIQLTNVTNGCSM